MRKTIGAALATVKGMTLESAHDELHNIWIGQCEAAEGVEDEFGAPKALEDIVGDSRTRYRCTRIDTDMLDPDSRLR